MLISYGEGEFLALADLAGKAQEEVPAWGFLTVAIVSQMEKFLLWKAGNKIAGFLYALGGPIYSIAAFYLLPEYRQDTMAFLQAACDVWKSRPGSLAILIPETLGGLSVELQNIGFERLVRLEMVQALELHEWREIELPEGYRLESWRPEFMPQAASLLARESRGTREGLFLCFPEPATDEACQNLLHRLTAGEMGPFLNDATGVLLKANEVVGVALMFSPSEEESMLWELAIAREHQSKGLAPALISHLQWGTRNAGLKRIRFVYCERNRAIRRLFAPRTIVSELREPLWLWLSDNYLSQRKSLRSPHEI